MFSLLSQLPKSDKDLKKHITALSGMADDAHHSGLFDHLYECLSILDSKSSSLLAFNSIIIAVFAIFMTGGLASGEWLVLNFGMATVLGSCLLLLSVVWVHWSTTDNLGDLQKHALILLRVRRSRTIKYRLAWYFAIAAVMSLALFIVVRFVHRLISGPQLS